MPSRAFIQATVFIAAVIYLLGFTLLDAAPSRILLNLYGAIVAVATILFLVFDRFLWQWPPINKLVRRPVLKGTWRGTVQSDYVTDPETGATKEPTEAYLVVRQTYSSLSVRFMTNESPSQSMVGVLDRERDGRYKVYYVYQNTPPLPVRDGSPIHHGGVILDVQGSPPSKLEGSYWTDRKTQGVLRFDGRSKKLYDDFGSARNGEYTA
jgi:hypothetical protein